MSFGSRLALLGLAAVAGVVVMANDVGPPAEELTAAALRQFDGGAAELSRADAAKNWYPLLWPAGLVALAGLLFWDDAGRLLRRSARPAALHRDTSQKGGD